MREEFCMVNTQYMKVTLREKFPYVDLEELVI
ncbi:hypothetical protein D5F86_01340 [Streptococcus agalactiae]|nr:hypothetical protein B7931_01155 [Streptococcus agalactiae]OTG55052.1 hypothetical protein B7933_01265 [Streptococcus agalactiae]RRA73073.1 hypothetical protein D5F89_03450 [Streptococcus agalactiae]RRA81785.1 hypothetical protein D5F86_01340 [Streptococcus agalactiae]RRA82331.1 hypothetical protein D5F82_04300 [Streptococcus agalactiae]